MTTTVNDAALASSKLTELELAAWIGQAAGGDTLEYHRGVLALGVMPHGSRLPAADRSRLALVARRAWWAAEHGLVHLVQRRHGADDYSYIAVARPKPKTVPVALSILLLTEIA